MIRDKYPGGSTHWAKAAPSKVMQKTSSNKEKESTVLEKVQLYVYEYIVTPQSLHKETMQDLLIKEINPDTGMQGFKRYNDWRKEAEIVIKEK